MRISKEITLSICFLLAGIGVLAQEETKIQGTLYGYNGEPMHLAHVHLSPSGSSFLTENTIEQVEVNEDGTFVLYVQNPGSYTLHLTGVHHKRYTTPIRVDEGDVIDISAKLGTNKQLKDRDSYKISADFDNYNALGSLSATKIRDTIYSFEAPEQEQEIKYQVGYGFPIAGIANKYELLTTVRYGSDHYVAVSINSEPHQISFDVSKYPPGELEPEVSFGDEAQNKFAAIQQYVSELELNYARERTSHLSSGYNMSSLEHDWSEPISYLMNEFNLATDQDMRDKIVVYMLKLGLNGLEVPEEFITYAFEEISPTSDAWSIYPNAIFMATNSNGGFRANREYVDRMINEHANDEVKKSILFSLVKTAQRLNQTDDHKYYYAKLVSQYPGSFEATSVEQAFSIDKRIDVGSSLPAFSLPSLEGENQMISSTDFEGKYYLIDIWATWCGPCIFEMENLHEAYEQFSESNFEILSISLDEHKNYVSDFREQNWPMPWVNAFDEEGFKGETMSIFEVYGIPKALLVNPNGEIIAMDGELRGENLLNTLQKHLISKLSR